MEKSKVLRTIGALAAGVVLMGTSAYAQPDEYYFRLETSQASFTKLSVKKTYNTFGYVSVTSPDPFHYVATFQFRNRGSAVKSSTAKISKLGDYKLSYLGYGVAKDDSLRLRCYNDTTANKGSQITVRGGYEL